MKRILTLSFVFFIIFSFSPANAEIIGFEDLTLAPESFWSGSDGAGGFMSADAFFNNNYLYYPDYNMVSWDGFSYSNRTDTHASDWEETQYIATPGEGAQGSNTYGVGYVNTFEQNFPTVTFSSAKVVQGAYFTNNLYAYDYAKKFEEGDWFKLTVTGMDESGNMTGSVEVFLAEGTDIVHTWIWTDLSSLGEVWALEFTLSSSDNDETWGMNTPAYFCMDNLNITKPSTGSQGSGSARMYPAYMGIYPLTGYFGASSNFGLYSGMNPFSGYTAYFGYPMAYPSAGSAISYIGQTPGSYLWNYGSGGYSLTGTPGTYSFSNFRYPYIMQPFTGNYMNSSLLNYPGIYSGSNYLWSYPYW